MIRKEVREERLRSSPSPAIGLSCWRGVSGRRYVVSCQRLDRLTDTDQRDVVILGVRRNADGIAVIVGAGHRGSVAEAIPLARADGANELHVHRLEDDAAARDAIVEDLIGDDAA